ncbi:MAG: DUF3783 domain-containing protein [Candidatus Thermoplasmatota archaeon]|jgi:hypothetical protein|nr:DUF3783 domain-containing protein [Candidatus Thermoplasmatota archaeon]
MVAEADKKIVLLHNFDRNDYTRLLNFLKSSGLSSKTIVAVTTSVTLDWKVADLIKELFLEDEALRDQTKG